jgi:hypothetical protein
VGDAGSIEGEGMNREPVLESSECDSIGFVARTLPTVVLFSHSWVGNGGGRVFAGLE